MTLTPPKSKINLCSRIAIAPKPASTEQQYGTTKRRELLAESSQAKPLVKPRTEEAYELASFRLEQTKV